VKKRKLGLRQIENPFSQSRNSKSNTDQKIIKKTKIGAITEGDRGKQKAKP